jgi:hypothetical protein
MQKGNERKNVGFIGGFEGFDGDGRKRPAFAKLRLGMGEPRLLIAHCGLQNGIIRELRELTRS